jgi:hypothetical protein
MAKLSVIAALDHLMSTYKGIHLNSLRSTPRGHWINEAFVVRLWAVLESHGFVGNNISINNDLPGANDIDICRRLRNEIGHATGNVLDAEAQKLAERIRAQYGLGTQQSVLDKKFILSKDTVLRPMFEGVRSYCLAVLDQGKEGSVSREA